MDLGRSLSKFSCLQGGGGGVRGLRPTNLALTPQVTYLRWTYRAPLCHHTAPPPPPPLHLPHRLHPTQPSTQEENPSLMTRITQHSAAHQPSMFQRQVRRVAESVQQTQHFQNTPRERKQEHQHSAEPSTSRRPPQRLVLPVVEVPANQGPRLHACDLLQVQQLTNTLMELASDTHLTINFLRSVSEAIYGSGFREMCKEINTQVFSCTPTFCHTVDGRATPPLRTDS